MTVPRNRAMEQLRAHFVAFGIVTVSSVLSCAYLGIEDGSSGLSLLGWLHVAFFVPGGLLGRKLKGTHSNADPALMAVVSWITFSLAAIGIAQLVWMIRKSKKLEPSPKVDPID